MNVYEKLGVSPIINATGSVTRLGGAPMPDAVLDACRDAAAHAVSLEQLQAAASRKLAEHTGAEAGLVTCGAAAALTLGTAAILAGLDPAKMERLPHAEGFAHEMIVAREQRSGYDHAVRAAGAKLVEVGFHEIVAGAGVRRAEAWEFEAAMNANTAGAFYSFGPQSRPPLAEVIEVAHRHDLPVLVDAAGELPPVENLKSLIAAGADLVAFSGGKAIRGPQSTGILVGRRDLVASAALQMLDMDDHPELWDPPADWIDKSKLRGMPRHGIGRALKVSKEQIVALLAALDLFASGEYINELVQQRSRLKSIVDALRDSPATCRLVEPPDGQSPPQLEIAVASDAFELCRKLRRGQPPIYVGHGKLAEGMLVVHPLCLSNEQATIVGRRLAEELGWT